MRARLLAGGDDQRRAVLVRGEDVAHRVADAGRRVQVDEGGVARRLRVAVGHADHDRFLQAEHVAEVGGEVEEQRQLGRARVAEDAAACRSARSSCSTASRTVVRSLRLVACHRGQGLCRSRRNSVGDKPTRARKTRLKCAMLEKPCATAMSVTLLPAMALVLEGGAAGVDATRAARSRRRRRARRRRRCRDGGG